MSHNSKAVYQRYLGWYDANPANLWRLPVEEESARYVEAMGGAAAVLARGKEAAAAGDLRWAATLLNHLNFSGSGSAESREELARVYTRLGYEAEAGSWRNIYLNGAQELRAEAQPPRPAPFRPEVLGAATTAMILDVAAVRLNPEKAAGLACTLNVELADTAQRVVISVANGVLVHEEDVVEAEADATIRLTRPEFLMTLFGVVPAATLIASGGIGVEGTPGLYEAVAAAIEAPIGNFNVVVP
jgi:alkyl sulfatase BDS1-like metallo-beta-lactamase superfamily hydrolase